MDRVIARAPLALALAPTLLLALLARDAPTRCGGGDAAAIGALVNNGPRNLQAATTNEGFVVLERAPLQRVVPLAQDGHPGESLHLPRLPVDSRILGLRTGDHVLVHQVGRRVQVDQIDDRGELSKVAEYGRNVRALCDGVASNEHRFGVAWTEVDGGVWFLHGPRNPHRAGITAAASQPSYCGIASAGEQIALLWQDGATAHLTLCNEKRCARATKLRLEGQRQIRSFGCTRTACGIVARTPDGTHELTWVGDRGKARWTKRVLMHRNSELSTVGAGNKYIVIGHMLDGEDAALLAADESGRMYRVWAGRSDAAPFLVWAKDRLLFARHQGGHLAIGILKHDAGALVVAREPAS